jgi:hypothetical protein
MSNLDIWKQALKPETIPLSLGPALIRPNVRLETLVASGQIPTPLLAELEGVVVKDDGSVNLGDIPKIMPLLNAVAIAAFVDPPLTERGDDSSVSVYDVPLEDLLAVFARVIQGVDAVKPFREGQGADDSAAPDGDGIRDEAE